jgi:hypothetical protein
MLVFAGHPKCSLVWHQYVYGEIFKKLNLKVNYVTRLENSAKYLKDNPCDFLFYKSANYSQIQPDWKGFHIYRDPRDMLISGYFSSKFSHPAENHPKLRKLRDKLHQVDIEHGLLLEMDYLDEYFRDMIGWNLNDILFLSYKFEKYFLNEQTTFLFTQFIIRHLGLNISDDFLQDLITKYSFKNLTNREKGTSDPKHHFRKGIAGDWKNYFTPKIVDEFKKRYNNILIDYGYEKNDLW